MKTVLPWCVPLLTLTKRVKLRHCVISALVRILTFCVNQNKLTGKRPNTNLPHGYFQHRELGETRHIDHTCYAQLKFAEEVHSFITEGSNSNSVVMPVRWILQFYVLTRGVFILSVSQVYFRKGKVLHDSGFVGDALQLFLQCLALDEDFLPAKLEVERVTWSIKLDYYLCLDCFIKFLLW